MQKGFYVSLSNSTRNLFVSFCECFFNFKLDAHYQNLTKPVKSSKVSKCKHLKTKLTITVSKAQLDLCHHKIDQRFQQVQ